MASAPNSSVWPARLSALLLSAAAAASAVAWGLHLRAPMEAAPPPPPAPAQLQVDPTAVGRALGAPDGSGADPAAATPVRSRLVLVGVVARPSAGAALIAIDGKPPKPFAVGAVVEGDWRLESVAPRRAQLRNAAGETLRLDMPVTPDLLPKSAASP